MINFEDPLSPSPRIAQAGGDVSSLTTRKVEIPKDAKEIMRVVVITFIATTLIFGTLACLLFIPGMPLYLTIGTTILLAFAGKVAGTAALAASILLPAAFIITPTIAVLFAAQRNSENLTERQIKATNPTGGPHPGSDPSQSAEEALWGRILNLRHKPMHTKSRFDFLKEKDNVTVRKTLGKSVNQTDFQINFEAEAMKSLTDSTWTMDEVLHNLCKISGLHTRMLAQKLVKSMDPRIDLKNPDPEKTEKITIFLRKEKKTDGSDESITITSDANYTVYVNNSKLGRIVLRSELNLNTGEVKVTTARPYFRDVSTISDEKLNPLTVS